MSLRRAVEVIVEGIDRYAGDKPSFDVKGFEGKLYDVRDQLKIALAASTDDETKKPSFLIPENERKILADKAQQQANRALVEAARGESGTRMVELDGAGEDTNGTMISVDNAMPVGAKMMIAGRVFVLTDQGKMVYSESETSQYIKRQNK